MLENSRPPCTDPSFILINNTHQRREKTPIRGRKTSWDIQSNFLFKRWWTSSIAQLVKRVNGFEKYKKWAKLDPCFSSNKPTKQEILHFLGWSRPRFCTKKISRHFWKTNLAKIMVNVQKNSRRAQLRLIFCTMKKWWNWTSKKKKTQEFYFFSLSIFTQQIKAKLN